MRPRHRYSRHPFPVIPAPERESARAHLLTPAPRIRRPKLDLGPIRRWSEARRTECPANVHQRVTPDSGPANGVGYGPQIKFGATEGRGVARMGWPVLSRHSRPRAEICPDRPQTRANHPSVAPDSISSLQSNSVAGATGFPTRPLAFSCFHAPEHRAQRPYAPRSSRRRRKLYARQQQTDLCEHACRRSHTNASQCKSEEGDVWVSESGCSYRLWAV